MPDTPFKAMGRQKGEFGWQEVASANKSKCEKCGAMIAPGAWPFCTGKAEDHER